MTLPQGKKSTHEGRSFYTIHITKNPDVYSYITYNAESGWHLTISILTNKGHFSTSEFISKKRARHIYSCREEV